MTSFPCRPLLGCPFRLLAAAVAAAAGTGKWLVAAVVAAVAAIGAEASVDAAVAVARTAVAALVVLGHLEPGMHACPVLVPQLHSQRFVCIHASTRK